MKNHRQPAVARASALCLCAFGLLAPLGASAAEQERLLPPLVLSGEVGNGIWAYAQINQGLLVYDDGETTRAYGPVDKINTTTRGGIWLRDQVAEDFFLAANFEAEWTPYSTGSISRLKSGDVDLRTSKLRKAEAVFEATWFGKFWLGQGSMVSDGASEVDLSGTAVAAYSAVADSAGGQRFVFDGGGISPVSVGGAFANYDGLGRLARLRYDTPSFHGLSLRASVGEDWLGGGGDTEWDVAAVFDRSFGDVQLSAAAAYARPGGDRDRFSGSASALHAPTGLSLTLAAASDERVSGPDATFQYAKLGWRGDLIAAGEARFSVDWYGGDDVATAGSDSTSFGVAAVQHVPAWQTEFYATVRWYDYEDSADYREGLAVFTGARLSF